MDAIGMQLYTQSRIIPVDRKQHQPMNHLPRPSRRFAVALICVAVALAPAQVAAQGLKIVVINFDAAVKGAPLTQRRTAEQNKRGAAYQDQVTTLERKAQDLEADREAFRQGSPEWSAKNEELEAQLNLLDRRKQRFNRQLSRQMQDIYLEVSTLVDEALGDFARQQGYDLVLRLWPLDALEGATGADKDLKMNIFQTRDLLFHAPNLDRTQDFIDFLQNWQPADEVAPAKNTADRASMPSKASK